MQLWGRFLIANSDIHERETRYSNFNLICPKYSRKTERGRTFMVRTITEWNPIDDDRNILNDIILMKNFFIYF